MGNKHKKNKKDKHHQSSKAGSKKSGSKKNQPMHVLGTDAGKLATALIGTAVAEVAQVAIAKALESASDDSKLGRIRDAVKDTANTVKDSLVDATPSVQNPVATVKNLAGDIQPVVDNAIDTVNDKVKNTLDTVKDGLTDASAATVDRAKESMPVSMISGVVNTVADKVNAAQNSLEHTSTDVADRLKQNLPRPEIANDSDRNVVNGTANSLSDIKETALDIVKNGKDKKKKKHKKGKKA